MSDRAKELNAVDLLVKDAILNYFSLYNTRTHVLREMFFTTSNYEWVKNDNGLYELQSISLDESRNRDRIETREIDEDRSSNAPTEFHNLVVNWISDNIDEYCQRFFNDVYFNLRPRRIYGHLSRDYNNLSNAPALSEIEPVWVDAMEEIVNDELVRFNQEFGHVDNKSEQLSFVRKTASKYATNLSVILNAKEKLNVHFKKRDEERRKFWDKVSGSKKKTIEERYVESKLVDKISLEKYEAEVQIAKKNECFSFEEINRYIKRKLKTEEKYVTDGRLNEQFEIEATECLEKYYRVSKYFSVGDMTYHIMRMMKIVPFYEKQVESFAHDKVTEMLIS